MIMNYNEARKSASDNMQMAMVAEVKGEIEESLRFFELAFEAEKQAALSLQANFENEPTRSITFRSAAALAMDCKKLIKVFFKEPLKAKSRFPIRWKRLFAFYTEGGIAYRNSSLIAAKTL